VSRISSILKRGILCRTIAGNICDLLTITAPSSSMEELLARPGIVLTARVHPGETVSSWIMQGVIEFLISNAPEAVALRASYVFKIIPMMNPDGVINGNYRTNLSGNDLNRRWHAPDPVLHPTIFCVKELIKSFKKTRPIALVLDFHGQFFYTVVYRIKSI
jgi:murein tripeptide amidase MpaA